MKKNQIAVLAPATKRAVDAHVSEARRLVCATTKASQGSRSPVTEFARLRSCGPQLVAELASDATLAAIVHPALAQLYDGFLLARNLRITRLDAVSDQFALEFAHLQSLGLSKNQVRWMILKGYLAELGTPGNSARRPANSLAPPAHFNGESRARLEPSDGPSPRLTFSPDSLFALAPAGVGLLQTILGLLETHSSSPLPEDVWTSGSSAEPSEGTLAQRCCIIPKWRADLRELHYNGSLVKRFKFIARNQELVLIAFEEEHWPPRVDDPLPPRDEIDPKLRLRDTIAKLNRRQQTGIIRFSGDGTGRGIRWQATN
jgi:hypothetical protein